MGLIMPISIYIQILLALTLGCLGALWLSRGFSKWNEKTRFDNALGIASVVSSCGLIAISLGDLNSIDESSERTEMSWFIVVVSLLWIGSLLNGVFLCNFLNSIYLVSVERVLSILGTVLFGLWMIFDDHAFDTSDIFISVGLAFWLLAVAFKNLKASKA